MGFTDEKQSILNEDNFVSALKNAIKHGLSDDKEVKAHINELSKKQGKKFIDSDGFHSDTFGR